MNTRSNKYKNITFDIIFYLAVGILATKNYNNKYHKHVREKIELAQSRFLYAVEKDHLEPKHYEYLHGLAQTNNKNMFMDPEGANRIARTILRWTDKMYNTNHSSSNNNNIRRKRRPRTIQEWENKSKPKYPFSKTIKRYTPSRNLVPNIGKLSLKNKKPDPKPPIRPKQIRPILKKPNNKKKVTWSKKPQVKEITPMKNQSPKTYAQEQKQKMRKTPFKSKK